MTHDYKQGKESALRRIEEVGRERAAQEYKERMAYSARWDSPKRIVEYWCGYHAGLQEQE